MQRMGVDETAEARDLPTTDNELFAEQNDATPWWQEILRQKKGKHTPGLWVLYFSLAALPLFGIGQHWIPAAEAGRRRYVFSLLLVYVASALALLVTTSFLGLRRYLRQRRIEMPAPMAVELGRNRRGVDCDRDAARRTHPATRRRIRDLASAVASDFTGRSVVVALWNRQRRLR